MATCYRHPGRETGLACSSCGRPICPECLTQSPVGIRCPECGGRRTMMRRPAFTLSKEPWVTRALIAANIAIFLVTNRLAGGLSMSGGTLNSLGYKMVLDRTDVANGEWWRLVTSNFVHFGVLHIAFNMYALYLLGTVLERYIGSARFALVYFVSGLAGSFGALLMTPNSFSGGASGAIFGVMGALFVLERQRGVQLLGGPIGGLIVINLVFTFAIPNISVGGHIGGLIGGALVAFALSGYGRGHIAYGRIGLASALGVAAIAAVSVIGSLKIAG
ncbi:MAG: rhomboid family intramembrane serine protease [Gaiellales bacterium]